MMSMTDMRKVAFVTGTNGGIGSAIARVLLEEGYDVACAYHEKSSVVSAIEKGHHSAFGVSIDIRSRESIRQAVAETEKHFGRAIDIVVNDAGIADEKPFEDISDADWDRMLEINLRGAFIIVQETVAEMRKKEWGRIVNIVSIGGQWGGIRQVHYAAAKAGLINFTHSMAKLYSKDGITSNAVSPGLVATEMIRKELASTDGKRKLSGIPIGRITEPEEIAAAVLFLCSDGAASITGQTINVNGGMLFS